MRTLLIITVIFFSAHILRAQTDTVKIKTSAQCGMCKKRIENTLNFEKGIKKAELNVETKEAMVIYHSKKTSPEKIKMAIAKAGYDADDIPAHEKAYGKLPQCCKKGGHD